MRHEPYRARQINKNTWVVDTGAVCYPYLLIGEEKALVIDTGMGTGDLRAYLETITDLPIEAVTTHGHMDHTLCNGQFDKVYMHPAAIEDSFNGKWSESNFAGGPWPDFEPIPVENGHVFDLGGRHIEVVYAECHSPGDLMFIDRENRLLFTGDNVEAGQVLIFYGNGNVGATVERHLEVMKMLKAREEEFDTICPAHNGAPLHKSYIDYYIENDERILSGIEGTSPLASPTWNIEGEQGSAFGLTAERKANMRCSEWKGTSLVYDIRKIKKEDSAALWHINSGIPM